MLKSDKRHSQTLNKKKNKPIEITLTQKHQNSHKQKHSNLFPPQHQKYENSKQASINKNIHSILTTNRAFPKPLKQKNINFIPTTTIQSYDLYDMKNIKFTQEKLKKQVCHQDYKLNWISTSNHYSQSLVRDNQLQDQKYLSKQLSQKQLNYLMKTVDYKKIVNDAKQTYEIEHKKLSDSIEEASTRFLQQQNRNRSVTCSNSVYTQGNKSCQNQVHRKIKGITKTFLKQNTQNAYKTNRPIKEFIDFAKSTLQEKQQTQILKERISQLPIQPISILSTSNFRQDFNLIQDFQNEQKTKQQYSQTLVIQKKNLHEYLSRQVESFQINENHPSDQFLLEKQQYPCQKIIHQRNNQKIIDQKIKQTKNLKQQIARLSQRLQSCVQQIDFIEKNNSTQKVVQLENQLYHVKAQNQAERQILQKKILQLQQQVKQKENNQFIQVQKISFQTQTQTQIYIQKQQQTQIKCINCSQTDELERQVVFLRESLRQTNQKLFSSSHRSSIFKTNQSAETRDVESLQYQIQMSKKRYQTLEQILQSKKKEITNKDAVIQILMNNELQKSTTRNGNLSVDQQKKQKLKSIVNELFHTFEKRIKQM